LSIIISFYDTNIIIIIQRTKSVGEIGVEPMCDQLLFLLVISERRYTPIIKKPSFVEGFRFS